jgi:hypothetical protein
VASQGSEYGRRAMEAPVTHFALWSVRPPDLMQQGASKLGKRQLCGSANAAGMSGVIQKHSAATGEFWALLQSDAPGIFGVLRTKLRDRQYAVVEVPRADVPSALLLQLDRKPVEVLPSAEDVHSRGSSGARDRSEIPLSAEEQDRITVASAFDDAADQASFAARQLRRIEEELERSRREVEAARAEAKEEREKGERERAALTQAAKEERERAALTQAAKEEREKGERERAVLTQAAKEEREKGERERAAVTAALIAAEVRAARAEALLSRRSCAIV